MAKQSFQDQRDEHLASIEDALYKQLFESNGEEKGRYKPYSFTQWLEQARHHNNNRDILGKYNFSDEEKHLRKANNPFASSGNYNDNTYLNQGLRLIGHGALGYGYHEGLANNRQFPEEVDRYMNPYNDKVVEQVMKDMGYEKSQGLQNIGNEFTKAGAHGSQILKPNAENKYDREMTKSIMGEVAKLRGQGYQQAAQIFNADRLAREQNIASRMQVPFGMQKFERGQLGTLENLNNSFTHDRQQGLNSAHGRFREQHDQPFNDISNLHSIFSQGSSYRPSGNYYEAGNPQNYFQESKKGGDISLKEAIRQTENKKLHFARGGFFNKLLAGKNPVKGFTNFKRALPDVLGIAGATFGGVGGGAISGAARGALLKQNILEGGLKGGMYGYAIPAAAGIAGKALGSESGLGKFLGDYGASNAGNFGSFGTKYLGMEDKPNFINDWLGVNPHEQKLPIAEHNPFKVLDSNGSSDSWMDKLMGKDKGWLDYGAAFAPAAIQGMGMQQARKDAKGEREDAMRREAREREMLLRQIAYEESQAAKQEEKDNQLVLLNKPLEDERRQYEIAKMQHERERLKKQSALEEEIQRKRAEQEKRRVEKEEREAKFLDGLKKVKFERPILAFDNGGRVACFKKGGWVALGSRHMKFAEGGYVDGVSSGVKDNVRADLPEGSYVLDATTISLLGDGNSKAGAKKIDEFLNSKKMEGKASTDTLYVPAVEEAKLKKQMASGGELARVSGRIVPAKISSGEYVLSPADVLLFSKSGSLAEGAKMLDRMRERLKTQKGVKKGGILPPTKPLEMYLNAGY